MKAQSDPIRKPHWLSRASARTVPVFTGLLVLGSGFSLTAQTSVWNGGGTDNHWSTAANWGGTVPVDGNTLTFSGTTRQDNTNDLSGYTFGLVTLTTSGWTIQGDPVVLTDGFTDTAASGSNVWGISSTLEGNSIFSISADTVTCDQILSGPGGIVKNGGGTLDLTGNNTYAGSTTVSNGTVNVSGNESAATGGWLMPVNLATTTVNFQSGSMIAVGNTGIQVGSWPADGTPNYQTLNVSGTVTNNGNLLVARGGILNINNGGVWYQNGNVTNGPPPASGYSANMTVNSGGTFIYAGAGPMVISPSSVNSGGGTLTISGGTFVTTQGFTNNISPNGTIGSGQIVLTNNGSLILAGNIPELTSGVNTNSVPSINLTGNGAINLAGYTTAITNIIGGSGGLTVTGAGTLTLGATNTFSGDTTVSGATLVVSGSLAGSPIVTVGTDAVLQLGQNGALGNAVVLAVNAGGSVALNSGVNQTVKALCLGGQWEPNGTWGSTASGAANQNNTYFSGSGIITVSHVQPVPLIFNYGIKYLSGGNNPYPGTVSYMPYPGLSYVPSATQCTATWNYQWTNQWPVASFFLHSTQTFSTNTLSNGYVCSNSIADTIAWFNTNTSSAGIALNYVMSDDEPYAGYSGTQAQSDADVTNMLKLFRSSANTNVNTTYIGNYAEYPGTIDPINGSSRSTRNTFYVNSGLNIAQPNAYPYTTYTGYGPTVRAAFFWSSIVLVSYVETNMLPGNLLFPWLDNSLTNNPSLSPTRADNVALLGQVRMRGANGFCDLGGLTSEGCLYGWTDWDWLFDADEALLPANTQILNLTSSESSGYQWSGYRVGANFGFIFSNLGTSANSNSLPSFANLPVWSPVVAAGDHAAADYINDPLNIATNVIYVGRDGINHGLFVDTTATLNNSVIVAAPGTNPPALVTIGSDLAGSDAPVFAGSLTLSNNAVLEGVAASTLFSGPISGSGGITNSGTVTLSGTNSYSGGTTIANGTLKILNAAALGSGVVAIPKAGTNSGTLQLAITGVGFFYNTFSGFNSTTFTGDSTVPDVENVSGTNILFNNLTVTSTGGNGVALSSDAGLLEVAGTISTTLTYRGVELNGPGNGLMAGDIVDGSGGLSFSVTKDGTGTWTFSAANDYSGATTVNNGTLLVNGSLASGSTVTVAANATLGGTGAVSGTVVLNGCISPGVGNGVGTLSTGEETWNGGGSYLFQLNNATNSAGQDALNINGTLTFGSASSANPFTITLVSLTGSNQPGLLTNFDAGNNFAWTLATASGGIANFSALDFVINTAGFSNVFAGAFSVGTNGNSLVLNYTSPGNELLAAGGGMKCNAGAFSFSFSGVNGQPYRILASTNLLWPLTNWQVLGSGNFGTGMINFTDDNATNNQEFYQVKSP